MFGLQVHISKSVCALTPVCFLFLQLPIKVGHQNTHSKVSTEHNKECLINISKYKFSLVISGLTSILKNVNNMVSGLILTVSCLSPDGLRGPPK